MEHQVIEEVIRVSGDGDTKQKAIAVAINSVQREVLKRDNSKNIIVLRIEPLDIKMVEGTYQYTIEKFLFFFLPRRKEKYLAVLEVTVRLSFIDLSEVTFQSVSTQ